VFIYRLQKEIKIAVDYWRHEMNDEYKTTTTWEGLLEILRQESFQYALEHNFIFYQEFLDPCFEDLRMNNTLDYLFQYTIQWRKRLNSMTCANSQSSFQDKFKRAKEAALKEFDDLIYCYKDKTFVLCAALANSEFSKEAAKSLTQLDSPYSFNNTIISQIKDGVTDIFAQEDQLANWIYFFGSVEIDNERIESCFSHFKQDTFRNRQDRDSYLKVILNEPSTWFEKCLTTHYHKYQLHLADSNQRDRSKMDKRTRLIEEVEKLRQEKKRKSGEAKHESDYFIQAVSLLTRCCNTLQECSGRYNQQIVLDENNLPVKNLEKLLQFLCKQGYLTNYSMIPDYPLNRSKVEQLYHEPTVKEAIISFFESEMKPFLSHFPTTAQYQNTNCTPEGNQSQDDGADEDQNLARPSEHQ
jgi:hypothetical protein